MGQREKGRKGERDEVADEVADDTASLVGGPWPTSRTNRTNGTKCIPRRWRMSTL